MILRLTDRTLKGLSAMAREIDTIYIAGIRCLTWRTEKGSLVIDVRNLLHQADPDAGVLIANTNIRETMDECSRAAEAAYRVELNEAVERYEAVQELDNIIGLSDAEKKAAGIDDDE